MQAAPETSPLSSFPAPGDSAPATPSPSWIERSNAYARPLVELLARYEPEHLYPLGFDDLAEAVTRIPPDWPEQKIAELAEAIAGLERCREQESDPAVLLDLEVLIACLDREIGPLRVEAVLTLPYFNPAQTIFESFQSLLGAPFEGDRGPAALVRLRRYAGLEDGYPPLAEQAAAAIRARLGNPDLLGPYRVAVEWDLAHRSALLAGVRQLLEEHRIRGYEPAFAALARQFDAYDRLVTCEILPRCRTDFRLPAELYAARVRSSGVDLPTGDLASRARVAFREIAAELETAARRLAEKRGWAFTGAWQVLRELRKDELGADEILPCYRRCLDELEDLIRRQELMTLPRRPLLRVRMAGEAERAAYPYPLYRWPRLIGNRGEMGELVLPAQDPGTAGRTCPGSTSRAMSWSLAAHEGLPGHALQVSRLVDGGVSLARSIFGFNAAGMEGWAVYAESEVHPYLPEEAQLVGLHQRLRRTAAALLEPGLQQGVCTPAQAQWTLTRQVGLSAGAAEDEIRRYVVWLPGWGTSAFCGYLRLADLRAEAELRLNGGFERCRYHDFLLAQGLLPLSLLRQQVTAFPDCFQEDRAA